MAKKTKLKKTLVEQILNTAKIEHQGLQINALDDSLTEEFDRSQIYKTLALNGDKTGPVIGILPITEHEVGRSIQIKAQDLADFVQAQFADLKED